MSLELIATEINKRKAKLEIIKEELEITKINLDILKDNLLYSKEALNIIQIVAQQTQKNIQFHINNLVTSCLKQFGKNYKFNCDFIIRRDKTECDMYLQNEQGDKLDPYDEVGGSILQICEFALRCSLWSLMKNKINNFLFLDEPFSGIKKNLYKKLINIVKEVSKKLNLQLIFITHDDDLLEIGDNIIRLVGQKGDIQIECDQNN
jgi:DNA repair exonuclease SbcCD ATPase subunit